MLSVTVPIYNAAKYLDECLQSLLAQTYKDYEIILVNDGSKDESADICNRYAEEYENIRVIHKENGGVHTARNVGLEAAEGEIVAFIDSDDIVDPQAFEFMIAVLEKTNSDLVTCGYKTEYGTIKTNRYENHPDYKIIEGSKECLKSIGGDMPGFIWNKIIKKSVIGDLRFRDDIPISDDLFFNYQLMPNVHRAAVIDIPLYHYRYVSVSLSKTAPISRYMGCLEGLDRLNQWVENNAPECIEDVRKTFIFWNTKTCEQMLKDYHPVEFKKIQQYLRESDAYIDKCNTRIRLLAKAILKSWKSYKVLGSAFLGMKRLYVAMHK